MMSFKSSFYFTILDYRLRSDNLFAVVIVLLVSKVIYSLVSEHNPLPRTPEPNNKACGLFESQLSKLWIWWRSEVFSLKETFECRTARCCKGLYDPCTSFSLNSRRQQCPMRFIWLITKANSTRSSVWMWVLNNISLDEHVNRISH